MKVLLFVQNKIFEILCLTRKYKKDEFGNNREAYLTLTSVMTNFTNHNIFKIPGTNNFTIILMSFLETI